MKADLRSSPEERTALDEAKEFLRDLLSNGSVEAKGVQREAKAAGIADATLRRAKKALCIRVDKQGFEGGWAWVLPEGAQDYRRCSSQNNEHLRGEMSTFGEKEAPKAPDKTPWVVEI